MPKTKAKLVDALHGQGVTATRDHLMRTSLADLAKQVWATQCSACEVAVQEEADSEVVHDLVLASGGDTDDESVADIGSEQQHRRRRRRQRGRGRRRHRRRGRRRWRRRARRSGRRRSRRRGTPPTPSWLQAAVDWVEDERQAAERNAAGVVRTAAEVAEGKKMALLATQLGPETAVVFEGVLCPRTCASRSRRWRICSSSRRRW